MICQFEVVILTWLSRFRWVVCQLDILRECFNLKALRTALESLPVGLNETYDQILSKIPKGHKDDALKVLRFLVFSLRPVSIDEVAEVVAVDLHSCQFEPSERLRTPRDLLRICSSLVTISSAETTGDYDAREHNIYEANYHTR